MKIILLASNPKLYSNQRIMEAAKAAGHDIEFVNVKDCFIVISKTTSEIYCCNGKKLENIDAVIPRIKPSMTFCGTTIVRQFEMMDVFCLNKSFYHRRGLGKRVNHQIAR